MSLPFTHLEPITLVNEQVLEDSFIPSPTLHREGQLKSLARCLVRPGANVLLHGSTGTGKTSMVRWLFREFERHTRVKPVYVNVWEHSTRFDILYEAATSVYPMIPKRGTATSEVMERITEFSSKTGRRLIVCLDELDQLRENEVLYNLLNVGCRLVLISNDKEAVMNLKLDHRIRSRLGFFIEMEFPPYTRDELYEILRDRAPIALRDGAVKDMQLKYIAMLVSQHNGGDARIALLTLKKSAVLAEQEGKSRIENAHIKKAWDDAKTLSMSRVLSKLFPDQRLLYSLAKESGETGTGELYAEYRKRMEKDGGKPVEEVTYRKYMHELAKLGLVTAKGDGRWRRYKVA